ncbi:MAG: hypothetical protein U9Q06_02220 [Nanoarchaeota archaeon]|nr:hypothetical protein [Nanoarchaeota archaeon]
MFNLRKAIDENLGKAVDKKLERLKNLEEEVYKVAHSFPTRREENESLMAFLKREREGLTHKLRASFALGAIFDKSPIQKTKERLREGGKISKVYALLCPHFNEQVIINDYEVYLKLGPYQ